MQEKIQRISEISTQYYQVLSEYNSHNLSQLEAAEKINELNEIAKAEELPCLFPSIIPPGVDFEVHVDDDSYEPDEDSWNPIIGEPEAFEDSDSYDDLIPEEIEQEEEEPQEDDSYDSYPVYDYGEEDSWSDSYDEDSWG